MRNYYYKISFFKDDNFDSDWFVMTDLKPSEVKEFFSSCDNRFYFLVLRCAKRDIGLKTIHSLSDLNSYVLRFKNEAF